MVVDRDGPGGPVRRPHRYPREEKEEARGTFGSSLDSFMRPKPHTATRPPSAPRAKCSEQPLRVLRTDSVGSPFRWALGPSELPRPRSQLAFPTARPSTP